MLKEILEKYLTNKYTYLSTDKGWLYFDTPKSYFEEYLGYYLDLANDEKIYNAVFSFFVINGTKYRHGHQNCYKGRFGNSRGVGFDICEKMYNKLVSINFKLDNFNSFEELHDYLLENKVSYYGALSIYDLSLRLGYTKNLLPQKVYLHTGAFYGWKNLSNSLNIKNKDEKIIEKENLPHEFNEIECYLIEDFLCCYKSQLIF